MVRFIDPGIRVQSRVDHNAVNEVIDDGRDWVDAAEAFVKCGGLWHRIRPYKNWRPFSMVFGVFRGRIATRNSLEESGPRSKRESA